MNVQKNFSIKTVLIKDITKSKSEIIFNPLPIDDPKVRCPNIDKAKKDLQWQPEVGLKQGIIKTIEWFKRDDL